MQVFPGGSVVKNPPANAGDTDSIPGSGRSSGEGNGNPLQNSCLGNVMDRGAWHAAVHGITKSQTRLSDWITTPPPYLTAGKTIALTIGIFVSKVMSLLFNTLSRTATAFLPRSNHLLISWLQSTSRDFGVQEIKVCPCLLWSGGTGFMFLVFWMLSFKPAFSLSSFIFIKRIFSSFLLSVIGWCHLHIWGYWYFSLQSWFQLVLHPAWHFAWFFFPYG